MTLFYFIIALGILIFIHELGHFLVAKKRGIGVEKFSLGFGPKLVSFKKGETTYMVSALPLGGYVKLRGEEPQESEPNDPTSYAARPLSHRLSVVFAGPFMNLLLAVLIMPVVFMIGRSEPQFWQEPAIVTAVRRDSPAQKIGIVSGDRIVAIDGKEIGAWRELMNEVLIRPEQTIEVEWERGSERIRREVTVAKDRETRGGYLGIEPIFFIGNEAIVDGVIPGSPAEKAGLQLEDEILEIDGKPVSDWVDMSEKVGLAAGKTVQILFRRSGEAQEVGLTPVRDEGSGRWMIGIRKDFEKRAGPQVMRKYPFFEAIRLGTEENLKLSGLTVTILGRLLSFQLSYKTLGGPIRIAQASAAAAKSGLSHFLYFIAFLSLQLGILNFLPIPVLDGGHILFMGIEAVIRRPVSNRLRMVADQVGFALLLTLMVLVTLHDVDSVWGFGKILEWVKNLL
ncbi:MAG: RIP metalloprotease RseP [Deltaproteobacteria bacterium]|nr:RIP metalloprotease RseP [Deltaproteobacteria bacterium]